MNKLMGALGSSIRGSLRYTDYKMVLVVRTDITMGKGKVAAQCAHAAVECYRKSLASRSHRGSLSIWESMGQPKIVVRVSSQDRLMQLSRKAEESGLITSVIKDAGKTQVTPGTITVLGIGPSTPEDLAPITSSLKLL